MTIAPGARVEAGGRRFQITHLLDLEAVLAKDEETGRAARLFIKDLSPAHAEKIAPPREEDARPARNAELNLIEDADWQEAQRRFALIRPLLAAPVRSRESVAEVAAASGVHLTTVYRWIRLYESTGRVSSLVPSKRDGGRGRSRLDSEVEKIVRATIEDFYLSRQQRSMQKTCTEVERRCRNAGVAPPHPNTVRNRITALTDRVKLERRRGKKAARQQFAPAVGHFPGADWPLAVAQIDHTPVDIILVDDAHRLPIGRPWITLAMDVFSRMVLGFYVSFDPPGALSTGLCISHAILPKEKWLTCFGITTPWPCWGLPKTIHADNAKEFRGQMLKRACEEHGIDLQWRPVATPHWGGHIERLLGTFLEEIHSLPGTTFSNPKERGEYKSDKQAAMTLSEFERWLAIFVVEVYHQRLHSALKTSPVRKYEEGVFGTKDRPGVGLPARTLDEDRLRLDFMPYEERTVQTYGVVIDEVHYYHDVLRRFINRSDPENPSRKQQFLFRRDPRDLSVIHFFDPELRQYFAIPYRDTSRPPISLWELREVRRQLEQEGREQVDENLIFDAYERMRAQEEQSVRDTKRVRRAQARRAHHEQAEKPSRVIQASFGQTAAGKTAADADGIPDVEPFEELEELS